MKGKRLTAALLSGALLVGAGSVLAAEAGSAGDPLISLSWLTNTFVPKAEEQVQTKIDDAAAQSAGEAAGGAELMVKRGDVLRLESGATVTALAGESVITADGAVVDLTDGVEVAAAGAPLQFQHRYLTAENTAGACAISSDTAVLRVTGRYQLNPSGEVDYNALATALRQLGLFKGTNTAYGSGFDLELTPTRIQGLIMFLRLIGEEEAALGYTGSVQFADVPTWALPYAAYAYDKGYTKGQGLDSQQRVVFGTEGTLAPRDYMTFLLRALGYQEGTDFQWLTALEDGARLGLITSGELTLLNEKPFHRAQVAYLSYFSLFSPLAGGEGTLLDRLTRQGVIAQDTVAQITQTVAVQRL